VPFHFVGLGNFIDIAHDKPFWLYLVNTFYMMLGMPIAILGSLWLAILLNRNLRGMTTFRTLLYLPSFTSGVALMILWKALYNPDFGPVNEALRHAIDLLGLQGRVSPPQWLLSTHNVLGLDAEKVAYAPKQFGIGARDALIYMGIWTAIGGSNMLLYLAALTNVPEELLEAAQLDGAGKWACFRFVTWAQLAPTTFFIVVMSFIGGLQGGFEQARVMTLGGPANTTTTLSYYVYSKAFEQFQIGYSSAVAWVLFTLIFVVTLLNWRFGNKDVSYA
jgi:multiple sugar transport system permease protein